MTNSPNSKSFLRSILKMTVEGLYFLGRIYFLMGIAGLIIVAFTNGIQIVNGRWFAIGILIFFPLHYLHNRLKDH